MNNLNLETYRQLQQTNYDAYPIIRSADFLDWYGLTYTLFTSAPLENIPDFWKIVAYTYSWMPTIPVVKAHLLKDPDKLLTELQSLKSGDDSCLKSILEELVPVINNSLTGTSKVLHFIAPQLIPIIDSNVMRGWDTFFFKLHPEHNVPKLPAYKTTLNRSHISKYLMYRSVLLDWVSRCEGQVSLRALEMELFSLGKNTEKERLQDKLIRF